MANQLEFRPNLPEAAKRDEFFDADGGKERAVMELLVDRDLLPHTTGK